MAPGSTRKPISAQVSVPMVLPGVGQLAERMGVSISMSAKKKSITVAVISPNVSTIVGTLSASVSTMSRFLPTARSNASSNDFQIPTRNV